MATPRYPITGIPNPSWIENAIWGTRRLTAKLDNGLSRTNVEPTSEPVPPPETAAFHSFGVAVRSWKT